MKQKDFPEFRNNNEENEFLVTPQKTELRNYDGMGKMNFSLPKKKTELRNNTEEEAIIDFLPTLFSEFMRFSLLRAGISCREACRTVAWNRPPLYH